jgi:hypothetical protein
MLGKPLVSQCMLVCAYWVQCYPTFDGCNLKIFITSQSMQAFPAKPNVCGLGEEPTQKLNT